MNQSAEKQMDGGKSLHFRVALVEKSTVPQGGDGEDWCRYVLENTYSEITGWRRGSVQETTQHAMRCAEILNARGANNSSFYRWRTYHQAPKTAAAAP